MGFAKFLDRSIPAEFVSDYTLEESVEQLRASVKRFVVQALISEAAVGKVSRSRVSLQRVIPFFGNSFKPYFRGSFQECDGRVLLSGMFTMHPVVKVFMTYCFGFCIFWTVLASFAFLSPQPMKGFMALCGPGMIALGFGFVRWGQWLSRNDIGWLSNVIQRALSKPSA